MVRRVREGAALAGLCVLAACGGGGGGGGGGSTVGLTLTNVSVPAVDQEVFEGFDPLQSLTVSTDVTGDLTILNGKSVYVIVEDADQLFAADPQLTLGAAGTNNQLVIYGRSSNARVGDFRGALVVNVCLDAACSQPFQGSPIRVPYHVKVISGLRLASANAVALAATFPAGSDPWTGQVQLPQGATAFRASLSVGSVSATDIAFFDLTQGANSVTISGKPAPVGSHDASLFLEANGTTSKGRVVSLVWSKLLAYTVATSPQFQIVYSTPQLDMTVASRGGSTAAAWVDDLASDGKAYILTNRIEYQPGDGVTTQGAGGIAWLQKESGSMGDRSSGFYWGGWFSLSATACRFSLDTGFVCLAPGRYDAVVYPSTLAGEESAVPLRVRLTVTP